MARHDLQWNVGISVFILGFVEAGLINDSSILPVRISGPRGLKPAFLLALNGTAEAVPYPKPSMRPVLC
jgi:hypothetical protein